MKHEMKLHPEPFRMIAAGIKTIELRLYDEKRRKIRVGDTITFTCTEPPYDTIDAKVSALYRYNSFKELYTDLPLLKCGYTADDISTAKPEDMNAYYPPEMQKKYGVLGIEIKTF
ncbi:MAG: ASCH domain-containing protein [Ruminococcus sp.]|nr:ASCH domain-containing protein [Ruminococcus sp.]